LIGKIIWLGCVQGLLKEVLGEDLGVTLFKVGDRKFGIAGDFTSKEVMHSIKL